jgi:alpha-tubulin suppressor-like RCC1 family protein
MKRIVTALVAASLLVSVPGPSMGADPLDPAGHPVSSDRPSSAESSTLVTQQTHAAFQRGDVFVAVSNGQVQWHLPDGTLNAVLDTGEGGFTTGMAFDDRGHLFLTGFQTNKIYEFDTSGQLMGTFAALDGVTDCQPESIVFDAAGNIFVGQAGCSDDVLKFAPDGTRLARYDVAVEDRGSDWIDLEPDQCTLRYTSEGTRVLRYDVCEGVQLNDWGSGLTTSYALRNLPDDPFDPDLLVASTENIRRMHFGLSATGYDAPGEDCWFALNLDPDATTFWSADFCTSNVYRFDIGGAEVVSSFNTGTGGSTVFGLAVFGELGTGTVRDCSSEDLSGAFGEVLPDVGERTTVRYDARFLVDESTDLFAAEARAIAEKVQERAERALDYYGTVGLGAADPGLGFALPETLRIEISCSLDFGPESIDPPTDGFVGEPGVIQLRLETVQAQLAKAAIDDFPSGDAWNNPGRGWKNLVDHEVFHAIQYAAPNGDLRGRYQFDGHTMIESPARLAQDLFPDTDDLAGSQYLSSVGSFAQNKPSVDRRESDGAYDAAGVLQYWGERFGPQEEANLERRVAEFLVELISAPGPQVKAYGHAMGGDALAALRDYYLAHYGLRAGNISAAENRSYAILDAETGHGGAGGLVPGYQAVDVDVQLDLSTGTAQDGVAVEPWAGNVVEITNIPDDATHVALKLDSGFGLLTTRGFLSAVVAVNPGEDFLIDPQLMLAGPNVFAPIEQRIPVIGRTRLFVVFVNGNIGGVDYLVSAEAVQGAVDMQFVDPTGNDPHRIQSATAEPVLLEVMLTVDGQSMPGDLPRSAFEVQIGGIDASVATADYRGGEYHLTIWTPSGLGAGSYPMTVTFAAQDFEVPGGLVIEEDAPQAPPQILRAASLGELGQGDAANASATVTPGATVATFAIEWSGSDFDLTLTAPSGRVIDEDSTDPDVTVTQTPTSVSVGVSAPESGTWRLDVLGTDVPSPEVVNYEASESGAPLHGGLFVTDQGEAGLPIDAQFAWSEPDGAVVGGQVVASVTDPTGTTRRFPLYDDGAHGDGGSADGVYAVRVWATDGPGSYDVVLTASGTTVGGAPVQRQAAASVTLGPKVDTDGDGVADAAEPLFGLNPADPIDGDTDHDGDGLGLAAELAGGTDPAAWDSDGGGESDRSELAAGRDPRDPSDDAEVEDVLIGAVPADGRIISVDVRTAGGSGMVQLYRLSGTDRTDLGLHPGNGATISDGPLAAGEYSYLAIAVAAGGAESGAFLAGPVTAADDVTPPDLRITLNGGRWETSETEVSVTFTDLTEAVEQMRLATNQADLAATEWVPFTGFTTVTIPSAPGQHFVYAQVRDAAGNESRVASGFVFVVSTIGDDLMIAWGRAETLGTASTETCPGGPCSTVPLAVSLPAGATSLAGGNHHTLALDAEGRVWSWGSNNHGQLGDGTNTSRVEPAVIPSLGGVVAIAAGDQHSLALREDGTVWAWGRNWAGQIGDGTTTDRNVPVPVAALSDVTGISGSYNHSLAVKTDGTVWAWGYGGNGQLGDGFKKNSSVPIQATVMSDAVAVYAQMSHSFAIKADGTVWTWPDGNNAKRAGQITGLPHIVQLATGWFNWQLALADDGTVWSWGANSQGQLGDGTYASRSQPVRVESLTGVIDIAAGSFHSLALRVDGTIWAWGGNKEGQITTTCCADGRTTPMQIASDGAARSIAAGSYSGFALLGEP